MGNCCSDKNNRNNSGNQILVGALCQKIYTISPSDMSKYDEVIKYCNELKNLTHPNVRPLSNFSHIQDQLVMNSYLHEDTDLQRYLEQRKNSILPSPNAKYILRQICSALQYLHGKNIIHGELNPKNIEINPANNEIQILNMSLPKTLDLKLSKNTSQMRDFESPELQNNEEITNASDLYQLGVIGLTLYGVSFTSQTKLSKPIHCPFGLYDKLKGLTNSTPSSRPPLDEVIDALDLDTQPGSINNIDNHEKQDINKKSALKDDLSHYNTNNNIKNNDNNIKSNKQLEGIREQSIHPEINTQPNIQEQSQTQLDHKQQKSQQFDESKQQQSQKIMPVIAEQQQQILKPKSEVIIKKETEKINYDFNPFSIKMPKDMTLINPMKSKQYLSDHEGQITKVITDNKNEYIITSSLDGSINVYQYDSKNISLKLQQKLKDSTCGISQILITKDNKYILAADLSSNIYIYTLKDFKLYKTIKNIFQKNTILSFDISSDNKSLLISATYQLNILCPLNDFQITTQQNIQGLSSDGKVCRFYEDKIIIGEDSGKIQIYQKENLTQPLKTINSHNHSITQISVGQDIIAVSSQDKTLTIYDKSFNLLQTITSHHDCIQNVNICNNDINITSNGWDGMTTLYKKNNGQYEIQSCFSNETSWSISSIYIEKNKTIISTGGRFLFIFV